ncbi:Helix-turn-helix domain-containing protein [Actinacidiphila yanglinensis]|uniref:Helix-turn-helix domain-containing protein n=1 Tax=Actinacidiphila yanglinensis TaxID=310779 RepID=A0A1H5Z3D7_9ACTN|nr:helix-turn-helix transcriptional regulator [Actinacidiphila yanglinensis]SEG30177.1 Helix-turn-helix domain-containing protein [Actinacidiphila yanglinensis]
MGDSNSNASGECGTSARRIYAKELARLRERAGLSLVQLGEQTRYEQSYLHRLEKGDRLGSSDVPRVLDRFYGTGDLLWDLWQLAKKEKRQGRYEGFMDAEAEAGSMQQFVGGVIPGLLQTERYAASLMSSNLSTSVEEMNRRVRERMARQARLFGKANLLDYRVLVDESAIRRRLADPEAWTEQLERIVQAAELRHVVLHVVPFGAGPHALLGGSLTLLWLPSGRNIAYLEGSVTGQLIEDSEEAEHLRLAYDRLRDFAMTPEDSLALIRTALEDHVCSSLPRT